MNNSSRSKARSRRVTVDLDAKSGHLRTIRVADLSFTGARVETPEWLGPGQRYVLRFSPELVLAGAVVRCFLKALRRQDDGSRVPIYEAGIQFEALEPSKREALARQLETERGEEAIECLAAAG